MIVYSWDDFKYFSSVVQCQKDPLASAADGHDVFLMPAECTEKKPPEEKAGYAIKWDGKNWFYEIIDKGDEKKGKTTEEKKEEVRLYRNSLIDGFFSRIERYQTQMDAGIETTDKKETYSNMLLYLQYLRDYPNTTEEWWEQLPLSFEEWPKK